MEGRHFGWFVHIILLLVRNIPLSKVLDLLGSSSMFFLKFLLTPINLEFMFVIFLFEITYVEGDDSGVSIVA